MDMQEKWKAAFQREGLQIVGLDDEKYRQAHVYMHLADIPEATVVTVSTQDDQELQPIDIIDDRIYAGFTVRPIFKQESVYFTCGLKAYHRDGDELPLPWTIKNMYRGTEAAEDVRRLCEQLFVGKSVTECNQMLGVQTHE